MANVELTLTFEGECQHMALILSSSVHLQPTMILTVVCGSRTEKMSASF